MWFLRIIFLVIDFPKRRRLRQRLNDYHSQEVLNVFSKKKVTPAAAFALVMALALFSVILVKG